MNSTPPSADPSTPKSRPPAAPLRRWALRGLHIVAASYLAACLVLYLAQNWFIFPGTFLRHGQVIRAEDHPGVSILRLHTAEGHLVRAAFGAALNADGSPRPDAATRPTLLFFYGNGDCIKTSMGTFAEFRRLGANVMIPEYVGYPMSRGHPSDAGVYATADAAYEHLLHRPDIDPKQIVIVGRSLGAAAAIDLASRKPVAGLATFSAFTSMDEMTRRFLPVFPTSVFLRSHFRNDQKIGLVRCPLFMAHGTADDFVPFDMMPRLAARASQRVTTVPVEGGDHNSIFLKGGDRLKAKFAEFLSTLDARSEDHAST